MTTMIQIHRLKPAGIEVLWAHINGCKQDKKAGKPIRPLPAVLLSGTDFAEPMGLNVEIDLEEKFPSRFEFAEYICGRFGTAWKEELLGDPGLWAWLAVAYWDQFTAAGVNRQDHYIPMMGHYAGRLGHQRIDYRSCTRSPVLLYHRFGDQAKFFLKGSAKVPSSMATMGDLIEQLLGKQDVFGNDRIMETIMSHYSDADGRMQTGATGYTKKKGKKLKSGKWSKTGYGKVRRLVEGVLPRLKLTYNVNELLAAEVITLAGPEFSIAES